MVRKFPLDAKGFNPFGDLIGLRFTACTEGSSQCVLEVGRELLNPHGVLHGGTMYAMADTAMGAALYGILKDHELCTTVEIKIMYFNPVKQGKVICDTKLIHRSKKIAALESELFSGNVLVAKALGTFYIYKTSAHEL